MNFYLWIKTSSQKGLYYAAMNVPKAPPDLP